MDQPKRKRHSQTSEEEEESSSSPPAAKVQKVLENIASELTRPKSKKELRKERKEALKAKDMKSDESTDILDRAHSSTENLTKADIFKQKQQRKREERQQERKAQKEAREKALDARFEEQNRLRREKLERKKKAKQQQPSTKKEKKESKRKEEIDDYSSVYKSLFKSVDPTTGMTTCRLGVQYVDIKVGTGPKVSAKSLVTVKYQLRGGSRHGLLIDSSKKFSFRLGKGEVIQGWDIGFQGMRQGGVRHLIVPPKAGYGAQDIGAGPGAMLYFDITLLEFR